MIVWNDLIETVQVYLNATVEYSTPGKPFLDYYALPCTKLFMIVSLSLAVAFRIKMVCGVTVDCMYTIFKYK